MGNKIKNPIIAGFYPDPSICRVGDDYYLACSSFEMDPGIPVFHSKDLANWELIGNAVSGRNGFKAPKNTMVGGIMAPTIRFFNGKFYIIDSNAGGGGNFIITAQDPAGPWSEPYYMDDVPGIDASLFFDDDGSAYIVGTGTVWENEGGKMERGIWVAPFDAVNFKVTGEPFCLFNTALRAAASPEAPHLYHIGEYYYLIIAEGGTEFFHAVTTARGKSLHEFFEGFEGNPVLTHRHMGRTAKITNVGHADLVQLPDDSWYAVFLASRPVEHKYKTIGRETFICPVIWEDGWPVFSPETGKVEDEYDAPACLPWTPFEKPAARDDFDEQELSPYLVQWGTPDKDFWRIEDGNLRIRCVAEKIDTEPVPFTMMDGSEDKFAPFISRRMTAFDAEVSCKMDFVPAGDESAGLALTQAINNNLLLEKVSAEGKSVVRFVLVKTEYNCPPYIPGFKSHTERKVIGEAAAEGAVTELGLKVEGTLVTAYADGVKIGETDMGALFPDAKSGGMVGTMIGMFASGNGSDSENEAAFDWFEMK